MENETFKVPCKAAFEFITPEKAKQMLGAGNRRNRRVTPAGTLHIKGIIERGEWMYDSTDAIGLTAKDEAVVNGQHRLSAIAEGNVGVWALVVRGVRQDIIKVVDTNIGRTLTQALEIDGSYAKPATQATAVKHLYRMLNGWEKRVPTAYQITVPQALELLSQHPSLKDSLELGHKAWAKSRVMSEGEFVAYHYAFSCADAELADAFFSALDSGLDITGDDPAFLLRERFNAESLKPQEKKLSHWQAMSLLITAWEATRVGHMTAKEVKLLRGPTRPLAASPVPAISDVPWLNGDNGKAAA